MKLGHRHHARHERKVAARRLSKSVRGEALRVFGSEKLGFVLAVVDDGHFVALTRSFPKQKLAVAYGERQTGQKAVKYLRKAA